MAGASRILIDLGSSWNLPRRPTLTPVDITIRPDRGRHRRPVVALAIIMSVLLCCTAVPVTDDLTADRPLHVNYLIMALALILAPVFVLATLIGLNVRNVVLRLHADGRVESIDWTGRRVVVPHPQAVRLHTLDSPARRPGTDGQARQVLGNLLVITDRDGGPPIVVMPTWWSSQDLDRFTTTLHIPIEEVETEPLVQFSADHPDRSLPLSLRHPWAYALSILVVVLVYLGLLTYLITHL